MDLIRSTIIGPTLDTDPRTDSQSRGFSFDPLVPAYSIHASQFTPSHLRHTAFYPIGLLLKRCTYVFVRLIVIRGHASTSLEEARCSASLHSAPSRAPESLPDSLGKPR